MCASSSSSQVTPVPFDGESQSGERGPGDLLLGSEIGSSAAGPETWPSAWKPWSGPFKGFLVCIEIEICVLSFFHSPLVNRDVSVVTEDSPPLMTSFCIIDA